MSLQLWYYLSRCVRRTCMRSALLPCCRFCQTSANKHFHDCSPEVNDGILLNFAGPDWYYDLMVLGHRKHVLLNYKYYNRLSQHCGRWTNHHVSDSSSPLTEKELVFARRCNLSSVNSGSGWMKAQKHTEAFYLDVVFFGSSLKRRQI